MEAGFGCGALSMVELADGVDGLLGLGLDDGFVVADGGLVIVVVIIILLLALDLQTYNL